MTYTVWYFEPAHIVEVEGISVLKAGKWCPYGLAQEYPDFGQAHRVMNEARDALDRSVRVMSASGRMAAERRRIVDGKPEVLDD